MPKPQQSHQYNIQHRGQETPGCTLSYPCGKRPRGERAFPLHVRGAAYLLCKCGMRG